MSGRHRRWVNEDRALKAELYHLRDWSKRVAACNCCNNCGNQKTCDAKPGWGEICAINCPLWVEEGCTDERPIERELGALTWTHQGDPMQIGDIIKIDGCDFIYRGLSENHWPVFDSIRLDLANGPDFTSVYSGGEHKIIPNSQEMGTPFDEDIYGQGE